MNSIRDERLAKAREIFSTRQFLAMTPVEKNNVYKVMISKGLNSDDLQMLIAELPSDLRRINRDVFRTLVATGNISGKDLVSVCLTNTHLKQECLKDNSAIIRQRLLTEFKYQYDPTLDRDSPLDLYIKYHRNRIYIFLSGYDKSYYIPVTEYAMNEKEERLKVTEATNDGKMRTVAENEKTRNTIEIVFPLEGVFLDIFEKPSEWKTKNKRKHLRPPVYLLMVMNEPQTSTMFIVDSEIDDNRNSSTNLTQSSENFERYFQGKRIYFNTSMPYINLEPKDYTSKTDVFGKDYIVIGYHGNVFSQDEIRIIFNRNKQETTYEILIKYILYSPVRYSYAMIDDKLILIRREDLIGNQLIV